MPTAVEETNTPVRLEDDEAAPATRTFDAAAYDPVGDGLIVGFGNNSAGVSRDQWSSLS